MADHNEASSQGSYDSTLEEMAKFDFDDEESIVRTIIFEGSDSENEAPAPTTAKQTLHDTDIITTNISFDDMDTEISTNIIYKDTQLDDTGQTETQGAKENGQESNKIRSNTKEVESLNNFPCIRETLQSSETDISIRNNQDSNLNDSEPIKPKINFPRTKITSKRPVKKFPGKMDSMRKMQQVSEQNPPETVEKSLENSDHIDKLATDSRREIPESEQRCIAASKIVTEYLINISPYMNKFARTHKSDSKNSKLAFNAIKNVQHHFFSVSYATLVSTISPYSNDRKFMENLCNLSVKLAQKRGILNTFNEKSLYALCSEMIDWTKAKMSLSKNDEMRPTNAVSHMPLTNTNPINSLEALTNQPLSINALLYDNPTNMHYTSHPGAAAKTTGDITLVFPAENVNSAIKISYNPALTSQLSIPSQSTTNISSNINAQRNIITSKFPEQPHSQPPSYDAWCHQQQQTPAVFNQRQEHVIWNNQQGLQQCMQPTNVIRQNPLSTIRINSCYQVSPENETRTFPGSNIPNRSEQYHSSPGQYHQKYMSAQRTLSFGQQQLNQMDQSETQQRNFMRLNNCPQERSTSRDSGFFSPVQEHQPVDCMMSSPTGITPSSPAYSCTSYQQPPREPQTSLKSLPMTSASFGACVVCKTLTNLTCLGCANTYYCGQTCQNIDWMYHQKDCKRNT